VPLENPKRSELTRIILRCEFPPPMPNSLLALFVTLRSILRSRVDLQVENLALLSLINTSRTRRISNLQTARSSLLR